ncbi:hypothetical protein M569_02174 [Genlisea aurea]|uniref:Tify domain-containing protein n=1 Tax=Genlisea aurea TaxID=192259 RepID=S8CYR3_9LAMI|nr:hypothetical protein M569_02174 [Genlisea aurea]
MSDLQFSSSQNKIGSDSEDQLNYWHSSEACTKRRKRSKTDVPLLQNVYISIINPPPILCLSSSTVAKPSSRKTNRSSFSNGLFSNVKSLLSTGILDGIPVKYVTWSREKHLRGVIKGSGYLCSCDKCKMAKVVNAYEFEEHAACKTKHPNNHIFFENGKTIYGVVVELKNTPIDKVFDAILNATGSRINIKNFDAWKASLTGGIKIRAGHDHP